MTEKLQDRLAYPPRALRAERAAAYLAMSRAKFLELVDQGRLPAPVHIDGMTVWDRLELDAAFDAFKIEPSEQKRNTVDMALGIK
jgi:predicted DNA-binding transcriptional regulator AlpA